MARTFDLGRAFVHRIWIAKGSPLLSRAITQETEPPFRTARSLVLRLWPTRRALVGGWWRDSDLSEEEALTGAVEGYAVELDFGGDYPDLEDPEIAAQVRAKISQQARSLEDEWQIINALGVAE